MRSLHSYSQHLICDFFVLFVKLFQFLSILYSSFWAFTTYMLPSRISFTQPIAFFRNRLSLSPLLYFPIDLPILFIPPNIYTHLEILPRSAFLCTHLYRIVPFLFIS